MFSFTPESADFWYKLAFRTTVILSAATCVAGFVLYKAQNARDSFGDLRLANIALKAAQANERSEELRTKNLELEKAIAPRSLEQGRSSAALRAFAGTDVYIASVPEFEARRFSGYLRLMFEMAGWHIHELPLSEDLSDGVEIEYSAGIKIDPRAPANTIFNFNEKGKAAAEELMAQLEANNVEVHPRWIPFRMLAQFRDATIPAEALIVRVGLKPTTYFTNQAVEELKSRGPVVLNNR